MSSIKISAFSVFFYTLVSIFSTVNAQVVVVRRRRAVGPIVAGCVVGSLFFLSILVLCCVLVRRRHSKAIHGIENPNPVNIGPGSAGGGTRIIAVRSRPTFWGRRRGLFRGPRVIAVSSWGGTTGTQQQQRSTAPTPSNDLPMKENTDSSVTPSVTHSPSPYGSQIRTESISKEGSFVMPQAPNQPEEAHIKESEFVGGFKP
ncbi:hypothetical protein BDZ94DRAFT_1314031 [Collybia nuda]|uniref:Transmembrane protein n=1 Tax=Collybia nuda TaxID=64659 RepID=A0A9P5XW27_9AGAR|nr:hypothetical protein BDZ94DRAFT_1314031 [Collybia nuda]